MQSPDCIKDAITQESLGSPGGNNVSYNNGSISLCHFVPPGKDTSAAVLVKNATKYYGDRRYPVLKNFNMCVPQGTIYSLLGPSGCGKTTALTCIVGIRHLNHGEILVFGGKPGTKQSGVPGKRVGYMPQDIALYQDFSIKEMIRYYGTLYGMKSSEIVSKRTFLVNFLNLPDETTRICSLSGGQKRRVSLAVALIHSPELLILDEPTVGVDPLLRESIWKHLCDLVSSGKTTVIITTHYIEEARLSQTIGLMRGGRLLVEKNPEDLINDQNAISLEEIVLKLCKLDDNQPEDDSMGHTNASYITCEDFEGTASIIRHTSMDHGIYRRTDSDVDILNSSGGSVSPQNEKKHYSPNNLKYSTGFQKEYISNTNSFFSSITRIKALAMKNISVLLRNYIFMGFLLTCPAIQLWVACISIGSDPKGLSVGVVNNETNGLPCSTVLNNKTSLQPNEEVFCDIDFLSCKFLKNIHPDEIHLIEYGSHEAAKNAAESGEIWGIMSFPNGFSDNMFERSSGGMLMDNDTLIGSQIGLEIDMTNNQIALSLQGEFYNAYKLFVKELLTSCGLDPAMGDSPLQYLTPLYGTEEVNFKYFIAPSSMLSIVYFFPLCSSSISFIWDKKQGTMERSMVAGVKTWEIVAAFIFTEGCILIFQLAIVFSMLIFLFDIVFQGSVVLGLTLCVVMGISGLSLGFLIASFCNEEIEAVLIIMATFFPNVILSGAMWPVQGMPIWLQWFANLIPCTLASESFRSIIARGWGFTHIRVWPGFAVTFGWIFIYLFSTFRIHRIALARK